MVARITGVVRWFSNSLGYGFIAPDDGGNDIFVHFSNVQMKGYKTLKEEQKVEFEVGTIEKDGRSLSNALEVTTAEAEDADGHNLHDNIEEEEEECNDE